MSILIVAREFVDALYCCEKLSSERKCIFDSFWATGNFNVQNAYLCRCVKVLPVLPSGSQSGRQHSRTFYVKRGSVSVRVCKEAFLSMHGVPNSRLTVSGRTVHSDQRERHEPNNTTKSDTIGSIKMHINSFPQYKYHYSRKDNPNREFLTPYLTIQKMYQLYKEKCEDENTQAASEFIYHKVFNEEF